MLTLQNIREHYKTCGDTTTEESEDEDADEEQAEEETRVRRLLQRFIEDPAQGDAPRRCGVVLMELMRHQR
jgi:hypothetical protein